MTANQQHEESLFSITFVKLWVFAFLAFLSAFQLFPTIPFRIIELGGTRAQAGWFLAVYTYASALAAPATGAIADLLGRRRVLLIACTSFIFFSLAYAAATSLPLLLVLGLVHGMIWSAILSSGSAIISEIVPISRRTEGMAYYGMASTAAVAVAPSVGLFVYRQLNWTFLCIGMAAISVAMLALVFNIRPPQQQWKFEGVRTLVAWRVVVVAMTLFTVAFGYGGVTSFVALLARERSVEPEAIFFSVFAVTILVSRIATARLGDRFGPELLLYPSLLFMPLALIVLAITTGTPGMVASAILFGLGFGGAYPAFATIVLAASDDRRRGATFGSMIWAFDTGIGTGSFVVGALADARGFQFAFLVAAAASALAIPIYRATIGLLRPVPDQ